MRRRLTQFIGTLQGLYYLGTGVWPIVHLPSFEAVAGEKTDDWLVVTVGAVVTAVGITLLRASWGKDPRVARWLGATTAIAFLVVDVVYVARGTISAVYMVDAALQAAFLVGWARAGRVRPAEPVLEGPTVSAP
jgi:hypothetical protein